MKRSAAKNGYTLVEMLISSALIALLLLVIIETAMALGNSRKHSADYMEVNATAHGAFSRFSRDIRRATAVDTIESVLNASGGKLVLQMQKEDGSFDETAFYLEGDRVKESFNGVPVGDLTPGSVAVSNLTFRSFQMSTTSAVRIEMTVEPDASSTVPALNFYSTYILRGSYTQ